VRQWNLSAEESDVLGENVSVAEGSYSSSMKRREQDRGAECRIRLAAVYIRLERRGEAGVL